MQSQITLGTDFFPSEPSDSHCLHHQTSKDIFVGTELEREQFARMCELSSELQRQIDSKEVFSMISLLHML